MLEVYAKAALPTLYGEFEIYTFKNDEMDEHAVLVRGDPTGKENVPVRIHSECLTGDVFGSYRCDCRQQLVKSMEYLAGKDLGILIYLRQEGRGIGLLNKIKAYSLQEEGYDTVEANLALGFPVDKREYTFALEALEYFKVKSILLMSNNPKKFDTFKDSDVKIAGRIPILTDPTEYDKFYLETKRTKMGHKF